MSADEPRFVIDPAEQALPDRGIVRPQRRARPRREIADLEVDPVVSELRASFAPLDIRLTPADFHPDPAGRRMLDTWDEAGSLWLGVPREAERAEVLYALAALRLLADGWPDPRHEGAPAAAVLGAGARALVHQHGGAITPLVAPLMHRILVRLEDPRADHDALSVRAWSLLAVADDERAMALMEIRRRARLVARRVAYLLNHCPVPADRDEAVAMIARLGELPSVMP